MLLHVAAPSEAFHEKLLIWKRGPEVGALDLRGYETRNDSILRLIARAEETYDLPHFSPLLVHTGDRPINHGDTSWRSAAFASADGFCDIPVPDFLFDGWPQVGLGDYEDACAAAASAGTRDPDSGRLGWIGNCDTNPIRWELHRLGLSRSDLMEIEHVSWIAQPGTERLGTAAGNQLTLDEQVARWRLLIDVEGNGWSARCKLLLHSGRPLLLADRPWHEWYWPQLRPMEHFIPVRRDLSDLIERVQWAHEHPDEARAIGAAGQAFARAELTRDAAVHAWAQTLRRLAEEPALPYAPPAMRQVLDPVLTGLGAFGASDLIAA